MLRSLPRGLPTRMRRRCPAQYARRCRPPGRGYRARRATDPSSPRRLGRGPQRSGRRWSSTMLLFVLPAVVTHHTELLSVEITPAKRPAEYETDATADTDEKGYGCDDGRGLRHWRSPRLPLGARCCRRRDGRYCREGSRDNRTRSPSRKCVEWALLGKPSRITVSAATNFRLRLRRASRSASPFFALSIHDMPSFC